MTDTQAKLWFKSRTLWLQAATVALGALEVAKDVVPPEWEPFVLIALAALNTMARLDTKGPVTTGKP